MRRLPRACLSAAVVVGISLAETTLAHVNQTTAALTLLLAVLGIATCWGLVESLAASVAGILCFNVLFLPPVGTLTIAAPENWVAFVTFVVTAVVASHLSATAKRRAREAARRELKSVMLDAVAHEFKTPLTAVKAAVTSLLSDASVAPARRELLEIVDEETDRLTSMVTEAIQVARIEAGRIDLHAEARSIAAVIHEALSRMKTSLESRAMEVQASEALPAVAADRELLLIVLRQLLDNAVKFSPPDSPIEIRACAQDDWMEVTVADRGPGLSRAEARRVFEEFYRGGAAGGSIPWQRHGLGDCEADHPGARRRHRRGKPPRPGQRVQVPAPAGRRGRQEMSARILVVDDEPQIRRVLRAALSAEGHSVTEARSGEEALEKLGQAPADLVLLDVNMPGMSGLEACRAIRASSDVAVIMLTVRDSEQDKVEALDAGADDYVTKPFSTPELLARTRAALRRTPLPLTAGAPPIVLGEVQIDFQARRVRAGNRHVRLTPKEFDLLWHLVTHPNRTIPHRELLQAVWGLEYGDEVEYLRVFVNQLRKKIEADSSKPRYLLTEPWVGYRLRLPERA